MSRVDDLRAQYQLMLDSSPEPTKLLFQGVLMGIQLAEGALAQDRTEELRAELAARPVTNGDEPSWRKSGTRGSRNPNLKVTVYGLTDTRLEGDPVFYVGSAQDPEAQLSDYIRAEEVKVSAKPMIDEIIGDGSKPGIKVLEEDVPLPEAAARKEKWILELQAEGATLVNQRRGS